MARLLPNRPELQIRLTPTDSDGVLKALVPHYATEGTSLPAGRHGGGLLALQTLVLLLEIGRVRKANGESFILALEEPELHVPPGLQRQIISEAISVAGQTICTTHSPRVAGCYRSERVGFVRRNNGELTMKRLLTGPPLQITNQVRKLLIDERHRLLEALMYRAVLVPEGRIDTEFLRLMIQIAQSDGGGATSFETTVGICPTADAQVVLSTQRLLALRPEVFAVVDGDAAGNGYITQLLGGPVAPPQILQWATDKTIEDVVGWVASAAAAEVLADISARIPGPAFTSLDVLIERLKSENRAQNGLKQNYMAYEEVAYALSAQPACAARAKEFLEAMAAVARGETSPLFSLDGRSTVTTTISVFAPAPATTTPAAAAPPAPPPAPA